MTAFDGFSDQYILRFQLLQPCSELPPGSGADRLSLIHFGQQYEPLFPSYDRHFASSPPMTRIWEPVVDLVVNRQPQLGHRQRGPEKGLHGLLIDRESKKVQATSCPGGLADFSRSVNMWYCFVHIHDSGIGGILIDALRRNYPGEKGALRQSVNDMNRRLKELGVKAIYEMAPISGNWRHCRALPSQIHMSSCVRGILRKRQIRV